MSKVTQAYIIGALVGIGASLASVAGLFMATTTSYHSTLFSGRHIVMVTHKVKQ